jgi:restriction system protein
MNEKSNLPKWHELMQPVLEALKTLGGSGSKSEVVQQVAEDLGITDEQLDEVTPKNQTPRFAGRVSWARYYLAVGEHIDSGTRGLWLLTEHGKDVTLTDDDISEIVEKARLLKRKPADDDPTEDADDEPSEDPDVTGYIAKTLKIIKAISPDGFEQLSKRLLRESGFQKVTVTGGSGDGGIDGIGVLGINEFMSFQVYFQCKRYKDVVGASVIRDFRGAMMGRANKGIILTTGRFTTSASAEAIRDGVPPIELVDGENFVRLLAKYQLGLNPVKSYIVDEEFFNEFK